MSALHRLSPRFTRSARSARPARARRSPLAPRARHPRLSPLSERSRPSERTRLSPRPRRFEPVRGAQRVPGTRPYAAAAHRRLSRLGAASVLTAVAVVAPAVLPDAAQSAQATTLAATALGVAASKQGSPYQWGATGPSRFDCSGLTLYSFRRAGKNLPRTAAAQYHSTRHISASSRRAGDLVFFHSGTAVYHVGIYAGDGRIWHAPKTGARVRLERIWTRSVWYGRVS